MFRHFLPSITEALFCKIVLGDNAKGEDKEYNRSLHEVHKMASSCEFMIGHPSACFITIIIKRIYLKFGIESLE
jgi:hypothetical protein